MRKLSPYALLKLLSYLQVLVDMIDKLGLSLTFSLILRTASKYKFWDKNPNYKNCDFQRCLWSGMAISYHH